MNNCYQDWEPVVIHSNILIFIDKNKETSIDYYRLLSITIDYSESTEHSEDDTDDVSETASLPLLPPPSLL